MRLKEWLIREGKRQQPPLTLEGLFERKLLQRRNSSIKSDGGECELSLKIQGERGMPTVFMQCILILFTVVPSSDLFTACKALEGLLWTSKDR